MRLGQKTEGRHVLQTQKGLTLVEVLISFSVLSILLAAAYVGFGQLGKAIREGKKVSGRLTQVAVLSSSLQRDIRAAASIVTAEEEELSLALPGREVVTYVSTNSGSERRGLAKTKSLGSQKIRFSYFGSDPLLDDDRDEIIGFNELDVDEDGVLGPEEIQNITRIEFSIEEEGAIDYLSSCGR